MIWLILIMVIGGFVTLWYLVAYAAGSAAQMDSEREDAIEPDKKREDIGWAVIIVLTILIWVFILLF